MNGASCPHPARELLDWYVNGTLGEVESKVVRDHLDACAPCSEESEDLMELSIAMERHGARPPLSESWPRGGRLSWRLASLVAAALALPAMMGLYWVYLGLPTGGRTLASLPADGILFDLGGGPTRGVGETPAYAAPAAGRIVRLRAAVPVGEAASRGVDLIGPGGLLLQDGSLPAGRDELGNDLFSVPSEALAVPGVYVLQVRETSPDGVTRAYRYPFRIE